MRAECVICKERLRPEEAISASECGHVFHEACITNLLGESDSSTVSGLGQCPQCRSTVDRNHLVRLFFSESCSAKDHSEELAHEQMSKKQALSEQDKNELERAKLRIDHLELKCELNATIIARLEQERKDAIPKLKWPLTDVSDGVRKSDETRMNEQLEAKLNNLDNLDKKCVNSVVKSDDLDRVCAQLEATTLPSAPPNDSGLTASSSSSSPPLNNVNHLQHKEENRYRLPANVIEQIQQQEDEEYYNHKYYDEEEEYEEEEYLGEGDYQQDPDFGYQQYNYEND